MRRAAGMRRLAVLLAFALVGLTACSADPAQPAETSPFEACPTAGTPASPSGTAARLVSVTLPCFTGGAPVDLSRLGRPAVINFWSSTCGPCRTEMPALQRFARAAKGRVLVIGVDTFDERDAAASAGRGFGVTYPVVFDPQGELITACCPTALPVTLFVDASGAVVYEHVTGALDDSTLDELAQTHLGITL